MRHDVILEAAGRLAANLHERLPAFDMHTRPAWLAAKPLIQEVLYETIAA